MDFAVNDFVLVTIGGKTYLTPREGCDQVEAEGFGDLYKAPSGKLLKVSDYVTRYNYIQPQVPGKPLDHANKLTAPMQAIFGGYYSRIAVQLVGQWEQVFMDKTGAVQTRAMEPDRADGKKVYRIPEAV